MIPKKISSRLFTAEQSLMGKKEIFKRLEILNKTQYYNDDKLKELQWDKLKKLIKHSYETVPYYRSLLDSNGIKPDSINSYDDYRKIPILTRKQISENRDLLISKEYKIEDLKKASSSGSTGEPLALYHTSDFKLWAKAHQLRNYNWCGGYEIGDRFALLWGSEIYFKLKTYLDMFENKLMNRIEFNTFRLNEKYLLDMCKKLSKFKPKLISSYPSSLLFMSEVMLKHNINVSPAAIQTTSETLTQIDRKIISERFNCKVMDKYGSRETNVIACECEEQMGMHINIENTFVEFLRDGKPVKPGEIGEIVVTNLNNYGMPLIRYAIGDLGIPLEEKCKCGRTLPLMRQLNGRESDIITTVNGDMIDSYFFSYLLQDFKEIAYFQIVQTTLKDITLNLVMNKEIEKKNFESKITEKINFFTNNSFDIHYEYVDNIPIEKSGKRRITISKVPFEWGKMLSESK